MLRSIVLQLPDPPYARRPRDWADLQPESYSGVVELGDADRAWFKEHDLARALAILDEVIAHAPNDTNALNFAGWLRTSQNVDFERGVKELIAALAGEDHRPAVNLAEALGTHGRAEEAVRLIRPWCEAHPHAHFAWNSLGWLLGVVLDDEQAALAVLARHPWFADNRFNAGRIHLKAKRIDEAEDCFSRALNSFRPHEAWLHLGEIHATRGHLRRALGAWRRAAVLDTRREYGEVLERGITTVGNALLQHHKYFLHADDDALLTDPSTSLAGSAERGSNITDSGNRSGPSTPLGANGAGRPISTDSLGMNGGLSFDELAALARDVRPTVSGDLATDCAAIERCAHEKTLLPEYSDQALWARLEKFGPKPAVHLAREWREAQLLLYEELLDLEEPNARSLSPLRPLRSAIARRAWDEAFDELSKLDRHSDRGVGDLAWAGELLGDRLRRHGHLQLADRAWALAEDAFSQFASWASAGAEGLARMADVNRLRSKRNLPLR